MEDRQQVETKPPQQDGGLLRVLPVVHLAATAGFALFFICVLAWPLLRQTPARPVLWWCFDMYCHNLPERSLWLAGQPLPVCSRCTGVIAGYLLAGIAAICGAEKLPIWRVPLAIVLIGLMGASWLGGQLDYLKAEWHAERVIAGALGGAGGYILIARCVVLALRWWQRRRLANPAGSARVS